jgi:hypothetical protein
VEGVLERGDGGGAVIRRYVAELARALGDLRVPPQLASRAVEEAEAHLEESSAEHGEDEAVRRFGSPAAVARAIAGEHATSLTIRATLRAFVALACLAAVYVTSLAAIGDAGRWPDATSGAVAGLGLLTVFALVVFPQVSLVAGVLALARALRARRALLHSEEIRALRARVATALVAGLGTVVAALVWLANFWDGAELRSVDRGWIAGAFLVCGVLLAAVFVSLWSRRPQPLEGGDSGDISDDLAPVLALVGAERLPLGRHPVLIGVATACAAGLAIGLAGGLAEGDLQSGVVRGVPEALAALAAYALLGRRLALRR